MPYIKEHDREQIYNGRNPECCRNPENAGELNYLLTMICSQYLKDKGERYQTYNDIMGVLTCIQHELYRRKIGPYENLKIEQNGDLPKTILAYCGGKRAYCAE